jgi:NAD(P)H-dependent FMN reductase
MKSLRQASTVDALAAAAAKTAPANATAAESEKKSDKPAADKP